MEPGDPERQAPIETPVHRAGPLPPPTVPPLRGPTGSGAGIVVPPFPAESGLATDRLPPGFSPERAVVEQLDGLASWAVANEQDILNGTTRFWLLKGSAFVGAVGALIAYSFGLGHLVVILCSLSALATAVDAGWSGPPVDLNRRALYDIRNLQNAVKLRWDRVRISHPDALDPARSAEALAILDAVQGRREEISRYVASPQSSPPIEPTF